jgi:hypothetical protein
MASIRSNALCALCSGAAISLFLSPTPAGAHFVLDGPPSWSVVNTADGRPEKLGPCGNEGTPVAAKDDAGRPLVTTFQEGQMITVTVTEVVFHPGHYRIALSLDWADAGDTLQSGFPADPLVTAGMSNSGTMLCPGIGAMMPCGSVPVVAQTPVSLSSVQAWILADNVFEHCKPLSGPQSIKVALPPGVTCKECVLQVLEFMSDHGLNVPGGCFYHHCANISIQAGGTGPGDASAPSDATVSDDATKSASSGGSSTSSSSSSGSPSGGTSSGSSSSTGSSISSGSGGAPGDADVSGSSGASGTNGAQPSNSSGCSVCARHVPGGSALACFGLAMGVMARRRRRGNDRRL